MPYSSGPMDAFQAAREAYRAGRIYDALEAAQAAAERRPKDPEAWRLLGVVSRHAGLPAAGDEAFQRAAALSPRRHAAPVRVTRERFQQLVESARAQLSKDARRRLEGVAFELEDLPDAAAMAGGSAPSTLSKRTRDPAVLTLYQGNHENRSADEADLARLVARTLTRA